MFRNRLEVRARTAYRVSVAVPLLAAHGDGTRRNQLIEGDTFAVQGDVSTFRLGDLQQVAANTGEADGLSRRRSFIGRGHLF